MKNVVSAQLLLQITLYFLGYYLLVLYITELLLLFYKGERNKTGSVIYFNGH